MDIYILLGDIVQYCVIYFVDEIVPALRLGAFSVGARASDTAPQPCPYGALPHCQPAGVLGSPPSLSAGRGSGLTSCTPLLDPAIPPRSLGFFLLENDFRNQDMGHRCIHSY